MTGRHLVTAAALLGWVVTAHAAATWQTKPYYTWTDAELKEVLTDSPWASKGTISYYQAPGARPQGGSPAVIDDAAMISWVSALPLRQAGVRQQMTPGQTPPQEVTDALAQPVQAYVIAVKISGSNGSSAYANGTSVMQGETFLLRDGKPPIAAIQSEGKMLDKDDKIMETPAGPRGAGGGGAPRGAAPANGPFFDLQRGGGGGGFGGGGFGGGGGGAPGGGGNRPRGAASMMVYVFPKTDVITAADKEVEFSSKLCTAAFGGFGGGGGGAPRGAAPANSPLFDMQRGGGGGGFGGGFGGGQGGGAATPPSATSTCRYNVKKKFKLKDMVFNGELAL